MTLLSSTDSSPISEVFYQQQGPLKSFIGRFLRRPHDVDDIAQETFIRAFKAEKTSKIDYPKAYIYRIARNLALRELTKKSAKIMSFIEDASPQDFIISEDVLDKQIADREKFTRLKQAIADLPPQCQRVFIMRKVYGFSQKEIARQLNISVSTVEKHISGGLKKCRLSVAERETPHSLHIFPKGGRNAD